MISGRRWVASYVDVDGLTHACVAYGMRKKDLLFFAVCANRISIHPSQTDSPMHVPTCLGCVATFIP